jgi:hypothetical protein
MRQAKLALRLGATVLRHPSLLSPLLGAAWRFRARGWFRRAPFLPLPPEDYLAWRLHTAFGDKGGEPDAGTLARYLTWTSGMRRLRN